MRTVLNPSVGGALLTIVLMLGMTGVAQDRPAPIRVGGAVQAPVRTRHVAPVYPPEAQRADVQGTVLIEALVGPDGRVSDARVLRSIPLLDQAALDAVRQWEFAPTLLNGVPVPIVMTVTVNFTLSPDGSLGSPAEPPAAQQSADTVQPSCTQQPETPARAARVQSAVRFAEELHARQRTVAIARQVRGYLPLDELPGTMEAPQGFEVQFLLAGGRYSLALKDVQDRCGASVFTDHTGSIHLGVPVSGR